MNRHAQLRCSWPSTWNRLLTRLKRAQAQSRRALRNAQSTPQGRLLSRGGAVLGLSAVGVGAAATKPDDASGDPFKGVPTVRSNKKTLQDFGHPKRKVTDSFILVNVICFILQWMSKDVLTLWGCKINELITAGQYWRLVTPMFLHSNLIHLAFNMHALHTLGPQVEVVSGDRRTAAIYLLSGAVATGVSYLLSPAPSLGASGAVFGLGAALAMFYYRHRDLLGRASDAGLRSLALTVAINVGYSLVNRRLDNWGHIGGLLAGAALGWVLGPRLVVGPGRTISDQPPLPWLAFKHQGELGSRRTLPPPPSSAQPSAPGGAPAASQYNPPSNGSAAAEGKK